MVDEPKAMMELDALSDAWTLEVNLPSIIKNIASPMMLNANAPADVREKFKARMEAQIDAVVRQAFIEGSYRAVCAMQDLYKAQGKI